MRLQLALATAMLCNALADPANAVGNPLRALVMPGDCAPPVFPQTSARFGEPPTVVFNMLLDETGTVQKAQVALSSGSKIVDDAVRAAIVRCTYAPAKLNGVAVAGWAQLRYTWMLD
jgi:TonB family protein